jgi:hypothetical protein
VAALKNAQSVIPGMLSQRLQPPSPGTQRALDNIFLSIHSPIQAESQCPRADGSLPGTPNITHEEWEQRLRDFLANKDNLGKGEGDDWYFR